MQEYELDAWLGELRDELTDEQYDRLLSEARDIEARFPGRDQDEEQDAALAATLQWIQGDTSLEKAADALVRARAAEREASIHAQQVARLAVLDGMSEVEAARRAGLTRPTVRKALGK